MAKHRFEPQLYSGANQLIRTLDSAGIDASIIEDSLRDYALKISVSRDGVDFGRAVIYYSPRANSFSLKTRELKDRSIATLIEQLWSDSPSMTEDSVGRTEIYVDGSFINGATGYGAVILKDDKVVDEICGGVDAAEVNDTRQVAGELIAVKEALSWCREHSVTEVRIYYDYLGIEKWATGRWKTNQTLTREYARFVRDCPVRIHWQKVESHSGNRWNDRADALAKKGAGMIQASSVEADLVGELLERTDRWIEFLMVNGIDASFDRVYNEQFARILIVRDDRPLGMFDLYNTRKKKFSPYMHDFRDENLKVQIDALWKQFSSREK